MTAVTIRGVAKAYGRPPVLRDVNLDVPAGRLTAVLGASGCGKTALLRIVAGFTAPDAGSVAIGRRIVCDQRVRLPPERRRVGFVAQDGALFPHLTVVANVRFGLPRPQRRALVMVRPEQVRWQRAAGVDARSAAPAVSSRVVDVTYYGHDAVLRLALDGGRRELTEVTVRTPGHDVPRRGEEVRLAVDGPVVAYPVSSVAQAVPPARSAVPPARNGAGTAPAAGGRDGRREREAVRPHPEAG